MPDGDRFERMLRGGGWRSAYKIAAGGGTQQRVVEKLTGACLGLINSENSECARKIVAALDSALGSETMPLFPGFGNNAPFESLMRGIDDISGDYGFDDFTQLCGRAAGRCFIEMEHSNRIPMADLEKMFAKELISEIVHRNFFHAVREGIALNAGRDPAAQREWENTVVESLGGAAEVFAKSLMSGRRMRVIRSEAVVDSAQVFNLERLNEPLRVLGAV